MANPEHLAIINQSGFEWNQWRKHNPNIMPDLSGADLRQIILFDLDLSRANLARTDLSFQRLGSSNLMHANLSDSILQGAFLHGAVLCEANLTRAILTDANLVGAHLQGAELTNAVLRQANLRGADLSGANLSEANLTYACLVGAKLREANLAHCTIYGISAWDVDLTNAIQSNLMIQLVGEPVITIENLEVAQFIYLLLNNQKIRDIINTITTKVVLILGRFTPERKAVLDVIREELRQRDYLPVVFDFDKPPTRDITETMRTLAHLSRFIIADLSDPKSIPLELQAVVPDLAVPVQPLLLSGQQEFSMFVDLRKKYHWVLATHQYTDIVDLLASLGDKVIAPAEQKAKELEKR